MRTRFFALFVLMSLSIGMYAQIPSEVIEVFKKSEKKMDNPSGTKMEMSLRVKLALVFSMNGEVVCYSKGDKFFTQMKMKVMGKSMRVEEGFDGEQEWKYTSKLSEKESDTLKIKRTDKKPVGELDSPFTFVEDYKKAKMKVKDGKYVITFSDPKDDEDPKNVEVIINKNTYVIHQFEAKMNGVRATFTINKITYGVSDNVFVPDPKKYPKAKVVRE